MIPKQLLENRDYPYKKAQLVNREGNLTKRWYVEFMIYDMAKRKLVRKRISSWTLPGTEQEVQLNKLKTARERTDFGKIIVAQVNEALIAGAVIDEQAKEIPQAELNVTRGEDNYSIDLNEHTFYSGLQYAVNSKIKSARKSTIDTYSSFFSIMAAWMEQEGVKDTPFLQRDKAGRLTIEGLTYQFLDYLRFKYTIKRGSKKGNHIDNTTYNNHRRVLKILYNVFFNRKQIEINPMHQVPELITTERANAAYTSELKARLKPALSENPQLWQVCQIIYYSLIRPNELSQLRIRHIRQHDIIIPPEISKTRNARYPKITPGLRKVFDAMELHRYNPDDLLFTKLGKPGPERHRCGENYFTAMHRQVADSLGLGPEYVLYSWKHTGVVDLYRAGVKERYIMQQSGHRDMESFSKYLRSLGLYTNEELINKAPEL